MQYPLMVIYGYENMSVVSSKQRLVEEADFDYSGNHCVVYVILLTTIAKDQPMRLSSVLIGIVSATFLFCGCGEKTLTTKVLETHPDGSKKKEIGYVMKENAPRWIVFYYPDGTLRSVQCFNGIKKDSLLLLNYPGGQKNKESTYRNDTLIGIDRSWYENGQVESETNYQNGMPEGLSTSFYKDGKKALEMSYKAGLREGPKTEWYENGIKKLEQTWKNDKVEGVSKEYYENGNLKNEQTYMSDNLCGLSTKYYSNGRKQEECTYKDGRFEGQKREWSESGRLSATATFVNGIMTVGERF